jgi:hypothetical protein
LLIRGSFANAQAVLRPIPFDAPVMITSVDMLSF